MSITGRGSTDMSGIVTGKVCTGFWDGALLRRPVEGMRLMPASGRAGETPKLFGDWVRGSRTRERYTLSLRDLADQVGFSHGYISKWELDRTPPEEMGLRRKKPPRAFIEAVARVTGADARLGARLAGYTDTDAGGEPREEARGGEEWRRRFRQIADTLGQMGAGMRDRVLDAWEEQIDPHYRLSQDLERLQGEVVRLREFISSLTGQGAQGVAVDVFWEVDRDRRFVRFAGPGLALLGLREEQVTGRTVAETVRDFPDLFQEDLIGHMEGALAGRISHWTKTIMGKAFDVQAFPYRDADGNIIGVIGASRIVGDVETAPEN